MQSLDLSVLHQALQWLPTQPIWLCTVLATYGSSPRPPGAMLVANAQGKFVGSLSGGCVEDDFLQRIVKGDYSAPSQLVRYGGDGLDSYVSLPCGGQLDILVEYLPATAENQVYLNQLAAALEGHDALEKRVTLSEPATCLPTKRYVSSTHIQRDNAQISLFIAAAPRLLIAGISSVALFCADFALSLGFEVLVCENRPDVLENYRSQLPAGAQLIEQFPANYIERCGCHANTAVVALTHDPRMDDLTLMEAVLTPAFYIGAMGSHKNSHHRRLRLVKVAELSDEDLARIKAPIGLPIHSKTPAEIALAVMADIVQCKNKPLN
ncbi:XdhC family protein [Enterobacteriaceae bacterium RIT691]|nr:XdhC family protein [Enterobacteriaceae bacterium RIT691]